MEYVRVVGLSRLDGLGLRKRFPEATIDFEDTPADGQQHGELVTVAVVAITLAGLQALSAWLLKNRKGAKIEKTIELIGSDGSRHFEKILIEVSESTTEADVAKELGRLSPFFNPSVFGSSAS